MRVVAQLSVQHLPDDVRVISPSPGDPPSERPAHALDTCREPGAPIDCEAPGPLSRSSRSGRGTR